MPRLKTAKDAYQIAQAKALFESVHARRELEKNEKELKDYFKEMFPGGGNLKCGDYIVSVTPKGRDVLVRSLLVATFGEEKVRECEKPTTYLEVNVIEADQMSAPPVMRQRQQPHQPSL